MILHPIDLLIPAGVIPLLADALPSPPIGDLGHWVWMLVAFLIIGAAILHGINEGKKLFARTPSHDERVTHLEGRLGAKAEIAAVEHLRTEIIPRQVLESDLRQIDTELAEIRREVKQGDEKKFAAMDDIKTLIEDRFKELDRKRSVSIGNLHEHLSNVRDRVSNMEASVKAVVQTQHAMDGKIDRLQRNHPGPGHD